MAQKKLPKRLTRDEMRLLLDQPNKRYPTGVRDRALIRVLHGAGLRCAESLDLKVRDVNLAKGELRINLGKGGRDRVVWVDAATVEMLDRWKLIRPRSEWFFCTLKGGKMHTSAVREMIARRARKAGITGVRVHPHMLRHTYASELLEDGYTIAEVQRLLGHARLDTTAIYLHVADGNLQRRLAERKIG
jgi:integrase/recombinase XerD